MLTFDYIYLICSFKGALGNVRSSAGRGDSLGVRTKYPIPSIGPPLPPDLSGTGGVGDEGGIEAAEHGWQERDHLDPSALRFAHGFQTGIRMIPLRAGVRPPS